MTIPVRHVAGFARDTVLNIGAALGLLVLAALLAGVAFGVRPVVITSGSMEPAIGTGAVVLVRTVPAADIEVGDVVTVPTSTGSLVTHRVVEVDEAAADGAVLTLRGDANPTPDAEQYPVTSADRMVFDIPLVGYALAAMRSPGGLVVVGALVSLLLLLLLGPSGRGGDRPGGPGGTTDNGRHRAARGSVDRAGSVGAAAVGTLSLAAVLAVPSGAAWTDDVAVSGTALAAYDVTKPAIQSCTVTGPSLGQKSATIVWTEVSSPHPIDYTARIVETGQAMTVTDNGSTRQTVFSAALLSTVLNQTYNIRITASLPAPGTTWTELSNQPVTIGLLGISMSCGVAS